MENNEFGVMYEAVFKSDSKEKLERLQKYWEGMQDKRETSERVRKWLAQADPKRI